MKKKIIIEDKEQYKEIFKLILNKEYQKALEIVKSKDLNINFKNENEEILIEMLINENYNNNVFITNLINIYAKDIDIFQKNKFGFTILHILLSFNFIKETIILINNNKEDFKLVENNNKETILTVAKKNNFEELIEIINDIKNKNKNKKEVLKTSISVFDEIEEEKLSIDKEKFEIAKKAENKNEKKSNLIQKSTTVDNRTLKSSIEKKEIIVEIKKDNKGLETMNNLNYNKLLKEKSNKDIVKSIIFENFNIYLKDNENKTLLETAKEQNNEELKNILIKFISQKDNKLNEIKNIELLTNTLAIIDRVLEIFEIFENEKQLKITEEVFNELYEFLPKNNEELAIPNKNANKFTLIKINDILNDNLEKI